MRKFCHRYLWSFLYVSMSSGKFSRRCTSLSGLSIASFLFMSKTTFGFNTLRACCWRAKIERFCSRLRHVPNSLVDMLHLSFFQAWTSNHTRAYLINAMKSSFESANSVRCSRLDSERLSFKTRSPYAIRKFRVGLFLQKRFGISSRSSFPFYLQKNT